MPRSGPITMTLPPFAGATRKLVLANVAVFFTLAVMGWVSSSFTGLLTANLLLEPLAVVHGQIWQPFTYAFLNVDLLGTLFAMLTLWFTGSLLEGAYGSRWLYELFFTSSIGGALLASAITFTHVFGLRPDLPGLGSWAADFGLLVAIGALFGDAEFRLWFILPIKARYLVTIYILIEVAVLLKNRDPFDALLQLCGGLCGFLYVKLAPRKGLAFGFSERYFGMRNQYYRWKRRRAARKFEVYMRAQNREVHFDKDGRYVDPDELRSRNPKDKSWMN